MKPFRSYEIKDEPFHQSVQQGRFPTTRTLQLHPFCRLTQAQNLKCGHRAQSICTRHPNYAKSGKFVLKAIGKKITNLLENTNKIFIVSPAHRNKPLFLPLA